MSTRFAHAACVLALLAAAVHATTRVPSRGDEVVERLRRRADPAQQ